LFSRTTKKTKTKTPLSLSVVSSRRRRRRRKLLLRFFLNEILSEREKESFKERETLAKRRRRPKTREDIFFVQMQNPKLNGDDFFC
jgi:hypothetical protein